MKSVFIIPRSKKEFDKALSLLIDYGKERKHITLEEDDDLSFAFLMKAEEEGTQVLEKINLNKSVR